MWSLLLATALATRPDVAVVISDDLAPYEAPADAFREALGQPVKVITLHGREVVAEVEVEAMKASQPRAIFAVGAKAAWAVRQGVPDVPVVWAQVHDPERYGIPGGESAGVRARVPVVTYLSEVRSFFPDIQSIGVIRAPLDVSQRRALLQGAEEVGMTLELREVEDPRAFRRAFNQLADKTDAVWLAPERGILTPEAFRTAVSEMRRRNKPLLADTTNMVSAGAAFAVTPDADGVGRQAADLVRQILDGAEVSELGIADPLELSTAVNVRTLESGDVPYEPLMLDFATVVD